MPNTLATLRSWLRNLMVAILILGLSTPYSHASDDDAEPISLLAIGNSYTVDCYCCVQELYSNGSYGTFGTICHEFSHCFGLPDLYPTNGSANYVIDDWSLMDDGNYINHGWCPPNYSPLDQILLGWIEPIELTSPTTVSSRLSLSVFVTMA